MRGPVRQQVVGEGPAEGGVTLLPALVEVRLFCVSTGDPWAGPLCDVLLLPLARDDGLPLAQGETAERPVRDPPGAVLDGAGLALCAGPLVPAALWRAGAAASEIFAAKSAAAARPAATIPILMQPPAFTWSICGNNVPRQYRLRGDAFP